MSRRLVAQALPSLLAGKGVPNLTQSQWSTLMKVARNTGVLSMIAMRNHPYDKFPEPMLVENLIAAANHFAFFRRQCDVVSVVVIDRSIDRSMGRWNDRSIKPTIE